MSIQDQMMENRNYWNDSRVQNSMFSSVWNIVEQGQHEVVVQLDSEWIYMLVEEEVIETLIEKWIDDEEPFTLEYRNARKEAERRKAIHAEAKVNSGYDWSMHWKVPPIVIDGVNRLYAKFEESYKLAAVERGKFYDRANEQTDIEESINERGIARYKDHPYCIKLHSKYEVCGQCSGSGKMTNPNIDCGGISYDDFYEDPDFEQDYFSGRYDQTCSQCNGKRVEAHPQFPKWLGEAIASHDESVWDGIRESCAERAMGA